MGNKYLTTINTFATIAYSAITAGFFYMALNRGLTDLALVIAFTGGYVVRAINGWIKVQKGLNE